MQKKYLALIVALDYELNKNNFNYDVIYDKQQEYYLINNEFILMYSGIGKVNAAYKTALLLNKFDCSCVINIGTAGSCNDNVNVFDLNIATQCQYGDVDVTIDSKYKINQIPYESKIIKTNKKNNKVLKKIINNLKINVVQGTAITIDSFITKNNIYKFNEINNNDIYSVDMESMAIAQICKHYNIPFSCLKIISDHTKIINNHDQFVSNIKKIESDINLIVNSIIKKYS